MATGSLIEQAAQQRIEILERELAECRSLTAGLKADLKIAIRDGFQTKVGLLDDLTKDEIDLVHNAFTAGFNKGQKYKSGSIGSSRTAYIDKLIYNKQRGIR